MKNKFLKWLALAFTCVSLSAFATACSGESLGNSSIQSSLESSSIEDSSTDVTDSSSVNTDSSSNSSTDSTDNSSDCSADSTDSSSETPAEPLESGLTFKTLNVNGANVSGRVSNATEDFSFVNEITTNGVSKYTVSLDAYGLVPAIAKEIPLGLGENVVYIIETIDDEPVNKYTVTLYRRSMFTVSFNTQGGTEITAQQVEEDSFAQQPNQPSRVGYTFANWNFDFAKPITQSVTIKPNWTANSNTAYAVEYYLQNLEDDGYPTTPHERITTSGTTGESISADIKTYDHFTHKPTSSTSDTIAPDGTTVLKVYYTRNTYTVTFDGNGGTLASGEESQTVKYGGSVTAPTYEKTGHTFDGFDKTDYTNISESFTVTALWNINQYTMIFVFGNGYPDAIITQDYNTPITIPTMERDGYILTWFGTVPNVMPAEEKEFLARWLPIFTLNGSAITGLTTDGKNLETLKIPAQIDGVSITTIGASAFQNCYYLTHVSIPNSVTTIGANAFAGCSKLQGNEKDNLIYLGNMENLYLYLRDTTSSDITSANIENSCKFIGDSAFYSCKQLTNASIPNGVTSIGNYAFYNCSALQNIEIPDTVTTIERHAFEYCSNLTNIQLSNILTAIESNTFYGCSKLTSITIPKNVTSIGSYAFYKCTNLDTLLIPGSVTSIGSDAFSQCTNLTICCEVGKKPIGWSSNWFSYTVIWGFEKSGNTDNGISWVQSSTDTINHYIYIIGYTGNETNVILPTTINNYSVTHIQPYTFADCTNLATIEIPSSVTNIGKYAFSNCTNLSNIVIPSSVTSIGDYAFKDCPNLTAYCAATSKPSGWNSTWFSGNVIWNAVNHGTTTNGIRWIQMAANTMGILGYTGNETHLILPTTINNYPVTEILYGAFNNCTRLTTVEIPNSVTTIGKFAFANCTSLQSIVIPTSVTLIDHYTFQNCSNLVSVTLHDSFIAIANYAFYDCAKLSSIELSANMTLIGDYAFGNCTSLNKIIIYKHTTRIGNNAFINCSNLTIYCELEHPHGDFNDNWNPSNCPVEWGSTGETYVRGVTSDGFVWKQMFDNTIHISGYTGTSHNLVFPAYINGFPVTTIIENSFEWNSNIHTVILPNTVTTIKERAFHACLNLTTVIIPRSVINIDRWAFGWAYTTPSITNIYCEAQSKPDGWNFEWYYICSVVWGHTYTRYDITNGYNYYSTNTNLNFQFISNSSTVDLGYTDWTAPDTDCNNFKQSILYNGGALPSSAVVQGFNQKDGLALSGITFNVGDTITIQKGAVFMRGNVKIVAFNVTLTWTYNGGNSFTCSVTP